MLIDRVLALHHRRWAAPVLASAVLVFTAGCGSDDSSGESGSSTSLTSSPPATVVTPSTETPSTETSSSEAPPTVPVSEPAVTDPMVTEPVETVPDAPASTGWEPAPAAFPMLAYIACCGSDWEGDPSPAVPADPAAALEPGIYNARSAVEGEPANGTLSLEIRPYVRCAELDNACFGGEPYEDTDLGVAQDAARTVDLTLDTSIRVAVSGFECDSAGQLQDIRQVATGAEAATLFDELDAAYDTVVGSPLRAGVPVEQIADDITSNSPSGFYETDCPLYSQFAWAPADGPPILALLQLSTIDGVPAPEPLASAAASWIRPTAIEVDDLGNVTVYLYAGFLS